MTKHRIFKSHLSATHLPGTLKKHAHTLCNLLGVMLIGICCVSPAQASETIKPGPDDCDIEWDRIKGIGPVAKANFERAAADPEKARSLTIYPNVTIALDTARPEGLASMYYLLARIPFVIGAEELPTTEQREDWFDKAAKLGHLSAQAALMRLRYRNSDIPAERRVDRETFLKAARIAAEAGDPEFAAVMMDTARDINAMFHCGRDDVDKSPTRNGCNPQSVVKPIETRQWAEVAARGGNPHAKNLLCDMYNFGSSTHLGAEKDANLAFQWCFATYHTACSTTWQVGILSGMYERGLGTPIDLKKASELKRLHRSASNPIKTTRFPFTTY